MESKIIEKLVISQPLSERLVTLGVQRLEAAFYWVNDFDFDLSDKEPIKSWQLGEFDPYDYEEGEVFPAWTSEEIRVMIGWFFNGCDMRNHRPKPMPGEHLQFVNYYANTMKVFESSAEGNGEWLAYLISEEQVKAAEANERYIEKFK